MIALGWSRWRLNAGLRKTFSSRVAVPQENLPEYFRLADVFVMPSIGEGFGIVFLEALASGNCVIGGDRDGSVDPLADGQLREQSIQIIRRR